MPMHHNKCFDLFLELRDKAQGFTIKNVENMVRGSRSWVEVREKFLINFPNNQHGIQANIFLSQWQ